MKRMKFIVLLMFLCSWPAVAAQTKPTNAPARVSVDLLVNRIDAYWRLLGKGKREQAALYITLSERTRYREGTTQQFTNPRLRSIEFSDDRKEATVTVMVKRIVPPMPTEMDFPVIEHWRAENGSWYRRYNPQTTSLFTAAGEKLLNMRQAEAARREVRKKLQFGKMEYDFGTVNQGKNVVLTVDYVLEGTDPVPFTLRSTAPGSDCPDCTREYGISVLEPKDQILLPGGRQKLSIEVPTSNYDGAVKEKFTITAKTNDVYVPFDFSVTGNVYVPISISPKVLRFKKGEREKEIVVRNNSKTEIRLEQLISESKAISFVPFPATIEPGGAVEIKVKTEESLDSVVPNAIDRMAITYTPVDGFSALSYQVYVNSVEVKKEPAAPPVNNPEIQELIRRNQMTLPRR